MRLAIVADTHLPRGARVLPPACVDEIAAADLVLHAGDVTTAAVLEEIAAIGTPLRAVVGNRDDETLRARLPETDHVEIGAVRIAMVHDAGPSSGRINRMRRRFPGADAVVFGHSHIPLHETDDDAAFQIFNPGSPTDKRRQPEFTMGRAEVRAGEVRFSLLGLGTTAATASRA